MPGQAGGLQRASGNDAHRAAADRFAPAARSSRAMNGNGHDRHLVGDRDDKRAVLELADGAIWRGRSLRIGQQECPAARSAPPPSLSGGSRETPVHLDHPDRAHAGPSNTIRNISRLASTPQRHQQHMQLHDRVRVGLGDWTQPHRGADLTCSRSSTPTRASAAYSHTPAHQRIIRSVTAESAWPGPRHHTSSATASGPPQACRSPRSAVPRCCHPAGRRSFPQAEPAGCRPSPLARSVSRP